MRDGQLKQLMDTTAVKSAAEVDNGTTIDDRRHLEDRRSIDERRRSPRRRVLKRGRVCWPNCDITTDCAIRNISDTGAQLEIIDPTPNIFDLVVGSDQSRHRCCVVWRKANRIGVKFEPHRR
jgi:hypothetical protein